MKWRSGRTDGKKARTGQGERQDKNRAREMLQGMVIPLE